MDGSSPSRPKMKDGTFYQGIQLFAGRGVLKSCGKCRNHVRPGRLKMMRPFGLCCDECRGVLPSVPSR